MTDAEFAALRPGDEVVVDNGQFGIPNYKLARVKARTATGRVTLDDGLQFLRQRMAVGYSDSYSRSPTLRMPSKALKEKIVRANLVRILKDVAWDRLATETLDRIVKAVGAGPVRQPLEST